MAEWTCGLWQSTTTDEWTVDVSFGQPLVSECEAKANARKIAATPDMFNLLWRIMCEWDEHGGGVSQEFWESWMQEAEQCVNQAMGYPCINGEVQTHGG